MSLLYASSGLPTTSWMAGVAYAQDLSAPTGSVTIALGGSAGTVRLLHLTASDDASPAASIQMRLSSHPDLAGATWQPFLRTVPWDFAGGVAVYAQFRDAAGNLSPVYTDALLAATPSCTPRPGVTVNAQPDHGVLSVTASVTGPTNRVRALRFESLANALVDVGDKRNQSAPFAATITAGQEPTSIAFVVRRQAVGHSTMVRLTVTDDCGDWSTFVGGGPNAF